MKKILLSMAILALGAAGCDKRPQPLEIDNALTRTEMEAGILTPEVMWKMRRAGSSSLSPDGSVLLYAVTDYNMQENRGVTSIYTQSLADKSIRRLTDGSSNNLSPQWSADGGRIYFLSDRSGSMQVWAMTPDGQNPEQVTGNEDGGTDIEGFGISPDGGHIWWVQSCHTADLRSKEIHPDLPHSRARIYDDLMVRHWDYWDEGDYRHIFIAGLNGGKAAAGTDIMPEARWDAPLAPYFDMAEIAWSPDGRKLAYTCKPLTGAAYAVSTDSDIYVYDLETQQTTNICKDNAQGYPMVGYDKYPVW